MDTPVASSSKIKPEVTSTVKPKGKKRKGPVNESAVTKSLPKRPKKKHGPIKDFEELPVEIVLEIFSQVDPADLLSLTRTTKGIRSILMNKNVTISSIWKNSFENMEPPMPECPDDLSEPGYAALAFDKACSFCGRHNITIYIAWECRVRTCTKCLEAHFTEHVKDLGYGYGASTAKYLPSFRPLRGKVGCRAPHKLYFWKDKDREWETEYAMLEGPKKVQAWTEEKVAQAGTLRKHGLLCLAWTIGIDRLSAKDQHASEKDRQSAVLDHLRKLGWSEDLDKISDACDKIRNLPEVKKACQKPLTDRALQSLELILITHMKRQRQDRLGREQDKHLRELLVALHDAYKDYLDTLPRKFGYATTGDIYQLPIIQDITNDCLASELSETHLERLQAAFPQTQVAWESSVRAQLLTMIEVAYAEESQEVDPEAVLNEASTVFKCSDCRNYVSVNDAFIHSCAYGRGRGSIKELHWNRPQILSFHPPVVAQMSQALRSLGYDSRRFTADQLNQENPIIECLLCHNEVLGRCTMQWNMLAFHIQLHDKAKSPDVHQYLRLVEEPQAAAVRSRIDEVLEMAFASSYDKRSAMCKHCGEMDRYMSLLDHIRTKHVITRPKLGADVIANPSFIYNYTHQLWPALSKEDVDLLLAIKSECN